jgi:hypothetical protein
VPEFFGELSNKDRTRSSNGTGKFSCPVVALFPNAKLRKVPMTRTGKIAQLPDTIRDEINARLNNGQYGLWPLPTRVASRNP